MTNLDQASTTSVDGTAGGQLVDVDSITPDKSLLADVQRTRVTTPLTRVLLTLVVIGAVFLAGALVGRNQHQSSSDNAGGLGALAAQFRDRLGASGASGASGALGGGIGGAGTTVGTVKLVDGKNVYVQDFQGNVVKVTTNASTDVNVTAKSTVNELKAGTSVIVQGTPSADGTSTAATSISQSSFGGAVPGGGGGPSLGSGG